MTRILRENETENVLATYYYLRHKGDKKVDQLIKTFPYVFLDSGAFSFREHMHKNKVSTKEMDHELQQYLREYKEFLGDYGSKFYICAELDVGDMYEKTRNRDKLLDLGLTNLLPVIHKRDSRAYIEFLCKRYPYVAIGSVPNVSYSFLCKYVSSRMRIAAKYGTKVHGLMARPCKTLSD